MTASATLDRALTDLIGKVRQQAGVQQAEDTGASATLNIVFSGGGDALPIIGGLPGAAKMPWNGRIASIMLLAGDDQLQLVPVSATVDLRRADILSPGTSAPIYPATMPTLALDAIAYIDLTDWAVNMSETELIMWRLNSFSGVATWLSVLIQLKQTLAVENSANVTDSSGDTVVDSNGNTVVYRG